MAGCKRETQRPCTHHPQAKHILHTNFTQPTPQPKHTHTTATNANTSTLVPVIELIAAQTHPHRTSSVAFIKPSTPVAVIKLIAVQTCPHCL